jgi:hypothetical protein
MPSRMLWAILITDKPFPIYITEHYDGLQLLLTLWRERTKPHAPVTAAFFLPRQVTWMTGGHTLGHTAAQREEELSLEDNVSQQLPWDTLEQESPTV